jgi:glycosyltransferase involved in cell wall biosynthesis
LLFQNIYIKNKIDVESNRISVGINFNIFYNSNKIFNSPVNILFSDHLLENKNVRGAVEIVKQIKLKYQNVKFSCFGVEKYNEMPDYIIFHKDPDDDKLRQIYCDSDIFLFTSMYEGFGLPPAEAMACKCAVVGNAVAAIPEYATHLETAILANPENPTELLEGVCYLLDNPDELKRISINGYNRVREVLNWDNIINEFEELIKNK